ncbi:unnamed protein product [Ostreobium quekettii]|uniref:Uncharacterized protein n=1 Tax=Ostreobium quekettii TaxID=121088 RepID=A0A8S1IM24_9CHLO|nr:unnamed protein product [Ostreobium quekettii]
MSLYGDLPQARQSSSADPTPWSANRLRGGGFRTTLAPPPSVLRKQKPPAPPPAPRPQSRAGAPAPGGPDEEPGDAPSSLFGLFGQVVDEYDPARPNEYEAVVQEKERRKRETEMEADRQERLRVEKEMQERELQRERDRDRHRERDSDRDRTRGWERGRVMHGDRHRDRHHEVGASSDEDDRGEHRGRHGRGHSTSRGSSRSPSPSGHDDPNAQGSNRDKGMSLAQRMLEKMGWKEGEGLGKMRQGMATPLIAQKTDKRSGVIVNAEQKKSADMPPPEKKPRLGAAFEGQPTKVVLLRNMIGPGEVDNELEDEVAHELQRFGVVEKVLIFEVTEPGFPPHEAVRIFVQFERPEESTKAVVALQGRYFGGRVVRAGFFDERRFDNCDLAPEPGEIDLQGGTGT